MNRTKMKRKPRRKPLVTDLWRVGITYRKHHSAFGIYDQTEGLLILSQRTEAATADVEIGLLNARLFLKRRKRQYPGASIDSIKHLGTIDK